MKSDKEYREAMKELGKKLLKLEQLYEKNRKNGWKNKKINT